MFSRKSKIELEAQAANEPAQIASAELTHDGTATTFALTKRVQVDKISIARKGKELIVQLGTDDGHFINIDIRKT